MNLVRQVMFKILLLIKKSGEGSINENDYQ